MKKNKGILWICIIVIVIAAAAWTHLFQYSPTIEMAINKQTHRKLPVKLEIIYGEEGPIYLALDEQHTIIAYSFYTKSVEGRMQYRLAHDQSLPYVDNCMIKMNTAPGSTEEFVFGVGESLANECSEKTGIEAEFIHFGNDENRYTIWYIISADGLDELPDGQLRTGVWRGRLTLYHPIPALIRLIGIAIVAFMIATHCYIKFKSRKSQ